MDIIMYIIGGFSRFMYFFQIGWVTTIGTGLCMIILAALYGIKHESRKAPWIVAGIGAVMVVNAGTQLLFSMI